MSYNELKCLTMTNVNDLQSKRKTRSIRAKSLTSRNQPLYVVTECFITIVSCTASLVHIYVHQNHRCSRHSYFHFLVFKSVCLHSIFMRCHWGEVNFQLTKTISWLWRRLPHRLSNHQSATTVLLRTPITQMIFFNQIMLLLRLNYFLI